MPAVVTYDIPEKQDQVRKLMFELGYLDKILGTVCEFIYLPRTTFFHAYRNPEQARDEIFDICKKIEIPLE